ncbi:MAG: hypothetical protein EA357_04095 [Micavibrio sp.]|nr:MAG: hypothetical protein EA357_04095 [Micavibrio sp.]
MGDPAYSFQKQEGRERKILYLALQFGSPALILALACIFWFIEEDILITGVFVAAGVIQFAMFPFLKRHVFQKHKEFLQLFDDRISLVSGSREVWSVPLKNITNVAEDPDTHSDDRAAGLIGLVVETDTPFPAGRHGEKTTKITVSPLRFSESPVDTLRQAMAKTR